MHRTTMLSVCATLALSLVVGGDAKPASAAGTADLAISETADRSIIPVGENVTLTITVVNHGPSVATDIVFGDPLPDLLNLVSFTCNQGIVGWGSFCAVESLPSGAQVTAILVATPIANPAPDERDFTTSAFISQSATADPEPGNNSASVMLHVADVPSAAGPQEPAGRFLALSWMRTEPGVVRFRFSLPRDEPRVELAIFDVLGRRRGVIVAGAFPAGSHIAEWRAGGSGAVGAARGIYLARLRTRTGTVSRKFLLAR